ncbi:molybdate ABC transporter substrate-binding protein [Limoniibacter endophyticus]|uniref:Molybdate ABC transporter substrate-binding protein n=1 Tax=Limoniibacter endophyticus TaxID=1565040 RepID=A0A8J3DQT6_9HYPH|nr:molybdate ABC transporter substrate-binding protein [Limoniibacter endophyticus]GHC81338.1 molybdate ABC transporter substrate-binding protein [Limoniibacter endophyticus]
MRFSIPFAALIILSATGFTDVRAQEQITVFAAASLKNALDATNKAYSEEENVTINVSYAASSALARQIENGAPADIFISADLAWMNYLQEQGAIDGATRSNLLGNRLVLVRPSGETEEEVTIEKGFDLAGLLGDEHLAMGAVNSVPAGKYGKAALEWLDVWPLVEDKVAGAENVRAALLLVSRGEAPFGIVYRTDASADKGVAIVGTFPEESHPPIIYPAAALTGASGRAKHYLQFLHASEAEKFFTRAGFTMFAKSN